MQKKAKTDKQPVVDGVKIAKVPPGLVDSKKKKLNMGEIVRKAAQETKSKYPPDMVALILAKELSEPSAEFRQMGNTLFVLHKIQSRPRWVFVRGLNADTANNYLQSALKLSEDLYRDGYDYLVSQFEDPTLLTLFKYIGKVRNGVENNMAFKAVKSPEGLYRVTAKLGPERG